MPTVDFTLEDFLAASAAQTEQIVGRAIERALVKEREHTRAMVRTMVDEILIERLNSFWDNNLAPVLEEMHDDIAVIKDIVKDHSFRIARLERHTGLRP